MPSSLPTEIWIFFSRSCYSRPECSISLLLCFALTSLVLFLLLLSLGLSLSHTHTYNSLIFGVMRVMSRSVGYGIVDVSVLGTLLFWMCRKEYIYGNTHPLIGSENVSKIKHVSQKHPIFEGLKSCEKNAENMAILDFTIRVSLFFPSLFSLPPSPFCFSFFSATLRKQCWYRRYTNVTAILDITIRVSLLLPFLCSLPPSPFSFLLFSATLRKQCLFFGCVEKNIYTVTHTFSHGLKMYQTSNMCHRNTPFVRV